MGFENSPDSLGYRETDLNACLIAFSTIFFGLRIYVRALMTKTLGWDDALAAVAYVFLCTQSALDIRAVTLGSGSHINLIPEPLLFKFFQSLIIQTLLYFWGVAFMRLSILAFLPRLTQEKFIKVALYVLASLIGVQTIVAFVYRLTECSPVADNFKPPILPGLNCKGLPADQKMMIGHAVAGIIIDLCLLILPIYVIFQKMIFSKKTIQVILVLGVGIFVIVTGIVRLVLIITLDFTVDPTYKMATVGIWTDLEGHVGLWCGSFPALQPLLRLVSYKLGLRSALLSAPTKDKYYGKSGSHNKSTSGTWQRSTKNGYVRNGSGVDEMDNDSQQAIVVGGKGDGVELYDMKGSQIQKTTEVKVQRSAADNAGGAAKGKSWVDM